MSKQITNPMAHVPVPPVPSGSRAAPIPAEVWARLQAEAQELKAQRFQNREQLLAWLHARGYEDGERILERLQAGGEI